MNRGINLLLARVFDKLVKVSLLDPSYAVI